MKEFDKIIGYQDIKAELKRICDIMRNAKKYQALGVSTPRGLLLHGEPGVGKTLMANCFIRASHRNAFTCRKDLPDGDFVKEIKNIFDEAKKNAPSIVFLDDMDKFSNADYRHRNTEEYVTVQACIDDCKGCEVFVLATANDLDNLPHSLLRAGRFDKVIEVKNPRGSTAEEIIDFYLKQKQFVGDIDAKEIAAILNGRSCAELETVVNEAGVIAGYAGKQKIEMDDIIRACLRVIFHAPEITEEISPDALERCAYHEAGHTVISELLDCESVALVSVYTHGSDVSGITSCIQDDKYFLYKKYMECSIMVALAGKAASEIKYGETDTGCNSDLKKAFDIASRFVDSYCATSFDSWEMGRESSNELRSRKEMRTASEVEYYYAKTRELLVKNRELLDGIAHALIEKKILIAKDIQAIKNSCTLSNEVKS